MKRTAAAVILTLALAACGGGSDTDTPASDTTDPAPAAPFGNVVDRADSVADGVNQRTADLESQLDG